LKSDVFVHFDNRGQVLSPMQRPVVVSQALPVPQLLLHWTAPPQPSPIVPQYLKLVPLSQPLGTQVASPLHSLSAPQT
jgi:hypothetical protein